MGRNGISNTDSYDVLVVGAGPAGATAAKVLVESGYSVAIVEKKKLPRYKMCSGIIEARAQQRVEQYFGSLPDRVFCRQRVLEGVRVCISGDSLIDPMPDAPPMLHVWRSCFDHWLTLESGADIMDETELIGLEQTDSGVRAAIRRNGNEGLQIEACYLVGADGADSRVRKRLEPDFDEGIGGFMQEQRYCLAHVDLDPRYFYAFLDPSLSPFFAWLSFKDEYLVYGASAERGGRTAVSMDRFTELLERNFGLKLEKVVEKRGCAEFDMGMRGNFFLGRGKLLLVGAAAGFMNGLGEGLSSAFRTGAGAASAILEAEKSSEDVYSLYAKLVKPEQEQVKASWDLIRALSGRDY